MKNKSYASLLKKSCNHVIKTIILSGMLMSLSACGGKDSSVENSMNKAPAQEETTGEQSEAETSQAEEQESDANDQETTADLTEANGQESAADSTDANEQEPKVELTESELQEFTDLFNAEEYNGFLKEAYNSPDEINWNSVLEFGAGLLVQDVSEDEINDYLESMGEKKLYGDLFVIRKSDLANYIEEHTGLSSVTGNILSWDYVDKHDSYYKIHWTSAPTQYTCVSGEKTGDHYELRFRVNSEELEGNNAGKHYGRMADRVLKFTKAADTMVMESNAIQWDDYCDEEQTFDIELSQYDSPIHFVTYSANPDEAEITIVKDGKFVTDLYTSIYSGDEYTHLKKIIAVGFFDFNGDGMDDIAIIGDSDFGKYAKLYVSFSEAFPFEDFIELSEADMSEMGCEFTIAGLKQAFLGDNKAGQYSSYQELYTHLAHIYNIRDEKIQYDLIYADDDDIPEFVVGYPGYWVSLVAFEDGKAHYLINEWAYGAGGNAGYSYAPKKGIFYNGNADYAGAIYYNTYMSKRDVGEIETDYWTKCYNFNDLDGDGSPSDDELQVSDEFVGSIEYYNETDKKMTEEEIKAIVDLYDSYETEVISGQMDYATFLDKLAGKEVGITDDQAVAAIKKYCLENNPDLERIVNSGDYNVYWNIDSSNDADIVVLYRSYTGAQLRYYIDRLSGKTYCKEFVPGITEEEQLTDESFNVKDYID